MKKVKKVGVNFLHAHPRAEKSLKLGQDHVIVDRDEWEQIVDYFQQHPERTIELGEPRRNTNVMERNEFVERKMCGDARVFRAIQDAKKNDTSFTDRGLWGFFPPKYSQSEVREIWFNAQALGMLKGLEMGSIEGQRIDLFNNCTSPRHKEFLEKFYTLSEEYDCGIMYHPHEGMCVVALNRPSSMIINPDPHAPTTKRSE